MQQQISLAAKLKLLPSWHMVWRHLSENNMAHDASCTCKFISLPATQTAWCHLSKNSMLGRAALAWLPTDLSIYVHKILRGKWLGRFWWNVVGRTVLGLVVHRAVRSLSEALKYTSEAHTMAPLLSGAWAPWVVQRWSALAVALHLIKLRLRHCLETDQYIPDGCYTPRLL